MKKRLLPILVLLIILFILAFRPLDMDLNQAIVLSALIVTVVSWVVGYPNKIIASVFLLIMFIIFGNTPASRVLHFPLSPTFILIIFSFIFSQGIINSNLASKLFLPFINRYARNINQFLITMLVTVIIMVFTIPQSHSRIILLSIVYLEYFNSIDLQKETRDVLMFSLFAFNIIVHVFFKRGDIVLNNGILAVANVQMSELEWMKNLLVPGFAMTVLGMLLFKLAFRKELKLFQAGELSHEKIDLNRDDRINLSLIILIILLWATESIHNISPTLVLVAGTIAMYIRGIISFEDAKSVNIELLFFLTAAFSIGNVMSESGIADKIFGNLTGLLGSEFNYTYILVIVLSSMILRVFLGSSVTTMSVAIPTFISLSEGMVEPEVIMFLVFTSILTFYLLPFHNSLLAVGEGSFYTNEIVFRFGLYTILLTLVSIFCFFIPWWKLIGLF